MSKPFDVVVIGAGPGGYIAAIRAAQLGFKVACIDEWKNAAGGPAPGGTCTNVGCIPSKALLHGSEKFDEVRNGTFDLYGIKTGKVELDLTAMQAQKLDSVKQLTGGIEFLLKKNKVDYISGWGKFKSNNEITVDLLQGGTDNFKAKNVIIATGSEPNELPSSTGLSFDEEYVVSSTGALSLKQIPKRMAVVGGGVIGLELGSVYQRLGSDVTVIQHTDRICPFLDAEVGKAFQNSLKK